MRVRAIFELNEDGSYHISGFAVIPAEELNIPTDVIFKYEDRVVGRVISVDASGENVLVDIKVEDEELIKELTEGKSKRDISFSTR